MEYTKILVVWRGVKTWTKVGNKKECLNQYLKTSYYFLERFSPQQLMVNTKYHNAQYQLKSKKVCYTGNTRNTNIYLDLAGMWKGPYCSENV